MPQFIITGPDGKKYRVTGPEGSSKADALSRVQAQAGATPSTPPLAEGIKTEIPSVEQPLDLENGFGGSMEGFTPSTGDNLQGMGRELVQGATFGWGDEAEAGVSSLLGRGSYEDEQARISGTQKQFAEENPKTALGLNVAGGLLTAPLTGAGGGLARTVGRMAAEGAVTGAGVADREDMLAGAGIGGVLGAGMGGLMKGGGQLIKKRLQTPLRTETKEGTGILGKMGIGKNAPEYSEIPYTVAAKGEEASDLALTGMEGLVRNFPLSRLAKEEAEYAAVQIPRLEGEMVDAVKAVTKGNAAEVSRVAGAKQGLERAAEAQKASITNRATQSGYRIGDTAKKRAADAQGELDTFNTNTREMAFDEAIPVSQRGKFSFSGNAQDDAALLKKSVTKGYDEAWDDVTAGTKQSAVKARERITKFAENKFDDFSGDDKVALKKAAKDVKNLFDGKDKGRLKTLDNALRKQITAAKDKPLLQQELSKLRGDLRKSIDPATAAKLEQMDAGYGDYLTVRKAVGKASDNRGNFTPAQLATASRMVGGESRAASGQAPLQALVDRGKQGARMAETKTARVGETAEAGKRFLSKATRDKKAGITQEMRDKIAKIPPAERKVTQDAMDDYAKAKDKISYLKGLRDNKPSIYYNLISFGVTSLTGLPVVGPALTYGAGGKLGQRIVAGQTGAQGVLRDVVGNKGASAIGTALRRGTGVGLGNYLNE